MVFGSTTISILSYKIHFWKVRHNRSEMLATLAKGKDWGVRSSLAGGGGLAFRYTSTAVPVAWRTRTQNLVRLRRSGLRNLYLLQWAGSEMVRRCLENARPFFEIAAFWVRHRTCPMPEIKLVYPYRSLRVFLCTSIRITKSLIST